jgi:methylmalonyl-CoA mutase cobalamin-binding subunit
VLFRPSFRLRDINPAGRAPDDDAELKESGVAAVYTPKDFELSQVMTDVLRIVERSEAAG